MKYVIGALVVLALLFLVWWMISRGRQQKLDQQRAEAASIRAGAQERAATIRGQETFAQHADERAAVARQEAEERARLAEESAREAQRVEAEARAHQSELERTRLAHETELRRADELDPDVEVDKNDPRPLPEDLDDHVRPLDSGSHSEHRDSEHTDHTDGSDRSDRSDRPAGASGAVATGAGAAALGSAYAASRGDVSDDEARRLASGADYSDEGSNAGSEWVSGDRRSHDDAAFAENSTAGTADRVDHAERQGHDMTHHDEGRTDGSDDTVLDHTDGADETDRRDRTDDTGPDRSAEAGGEHGDADMVIINDVEDYASTEPLPMEEQTPSDRTADEATTDESATDEPTTDDEATGRNAAGSDTGTGTGAHILTETERGTDTERDAGTDTERGTDTGTDTERDADTGTRSQRVSDEDLLGRGDDAASPSERGDATHWPDGTDRVNSAADGSGSSGEQGSPASGSDSGRRERRMSAFDEIRDGGFGVGSAAPLEDRAQPLDHPVQGFRDTMTYRTPGTSDYDSAEPDVWFYDEDAARRAGFTPSDG